MPRQTAIKKNKRQEVTQKDTYRYSQSLDVVAHPVDYETRVRPKARNKDYLVLAEGLRKFSDSIQDVGKVYVDDQMEKGKLAAARGEELQGDESAPFIKGHETLQGIAAASELNTVLMNYFEENRTADPYTYSQGKAQLITKFMAGRSDAFVQGILPYAMEYENKWDREFAEFKKTEFKMESQTMLGKVLAVETDRIYATEKPEDVPEKLRQLVTEGQFLGVPYKFTKLEIAAQFVDYMGKKAVMEGRSDLLKFTELPDSDGIKLIDNPVLAKSIVSYIKSADAERDRMVNKIQTDYDRFKREAVADITGDIAEALYVDKPNFAAIREKLHIFSDKTRNQFGIELPATVIAKFNATINELGDPNGPFVMQSDTEVYNQLLGKALMGDLDYGMLRANRTHLERDDYLGLYQTNAQAAKRNSAKTGKSLNNKMYDDETKIVARTVRQVTTFGVDLFKNGPQREATYKQFLNTRLYSYLSTNQDYPDLKTTREWIVDAEKYTNEKVPAVFDMNVVNSLPQNEREEVKQSVGNITKITDKQLIDVQNTKDRAAEIRKKAEAQKRAEERIKESEELVETIGGD